MSAVAGIHFEIETAVGPVIGRPAQRVEIVVWCGADDVDAKRWQLVFDQADTIETPGVRQTIANQLRIIAQDIERGGA